MRGIHLFLLLLLAPAAHAQVHRCTGPNGTEIFTDRRCEDVGGVERAPRAADAGSARLYRRGCSRTLQDLSYELTTALDEHDVNRLAGVYHWAGMSTGAAYAVMARLEAVALRPTVDIVPVYADAGEAAGTDYYPQDSVRRRPVALRLEQTLANGTTPSRTVLALHRYLGCWWVSL